MVEFNSEERGPLLGSSGYTEAPAVPLERTVFGLTLKKDSDNSISSLIRRGDRWPFIQRGVPAIWFNTGLHPDYHTIYDRPEKIDYAKMERIVRLVHQLSWDLAESAERPRLGR